jgi:hypothetical protein
MHNFTVSGAAVLLALAPSVLAVGSASVTNMCSFLIYYASIAGQPAPMQAMPPGGGMSESYSMLDQGVSIKLVMNDSESGPISQFEFTWASGKINYACARCYMLHCCSLSSLRYWPQIDSAIERCVIS